MTTPTLSTRVLNRSLLARQGLLTPWSCDAATALTRLVGVQSQDPQAGYLALWNRLESFDPAEVSSLLQDRALVRIALLRSTLFLVTAADALTLRPVLQSVAERGLASGAGSRTRGLDQQRLARRAEELLETGPLTFAELGAALEAEFPGHASADLGAVIRAHLALVQVPPRGLWQRSGPAAHQTLTRWLGRAPTPAPGRAGTVEVVRRYLAAFGPATSADVTAWSGLTGVTEVLTDAASGLRRFRDEAGRTLFDVPDGLLLDADVPAPVHILGGFDNVLLSHADRSRIFDDAHRFRFFSANGIVYPSVLVDGTVQARCDLRRTAGAPPRLVVTPFRRFTRGERSEITAAAMRLSRLLDPERDGEVEITSPDALRP